MVDFKIFWIRIRFSIGIEINIIISARVDFGISDAGFGMEDYASASLRIWKFSFGAQVSFAINKPALQEARSRVFEGVTIAGDDDERPIRYLPEPLFLQPPVKKQVPRWRVMPVKKDDYIYLLLLPEEDSWFACPGINQNGTYKKSADPAYELTFVLNNVALDSISTDQKLSTAGNKSTIRASVPWNKEVQIKAVEGQEQDPKFKLGSLYFEPQTVQTEHQLIDQILEDSYLVPELITDWRVRTEEGARDGMDDDLEVRPDVRSPKFSADGSIYDLALEEAFKYGQDDIYSWQALTIAQTRWTEEVMNKPDVMEYMLGQGYELDEVDLEDEKQVYSRRKLLLDGLENMRSIRSGLSGTLLRHYNRLLNSDIAMEELEVLATSGLAYRFKITDEDKFSLKVHSLKIDRGYGKTQSVKANQIEQGSIDQDHFGVGFEKEGVNYRLKDLLEFQDQQGIHFSWELESSTADGEIKLMTEREASGLLEEHKDFEYFDHYLVERSNLSSESKEEGYTRWEAKPGFVPAMVDIGDGNRNFYLVVPRFDFSDMFQVPVAVGDQLIYRFTAVDIFGNHSQTLEYLTTKKHLDAPPPPDKAGCAYEVELSATSIDQEHISIQITQSKEMLNWEGSAVRYEIWTHAKALSSGGYYGLGDDVEDVGDSDDQPIVSPKGMTLLGVIDHPEQALILDDLSAFAHGQVHTIYARSITKEGNASRLIRCEHSTAINSAPEKPYAYLERIPAASDAAIEWVDHIDLRGEVVPYLVPVLQSDSHQFSLLPTNDPLLREVSIKLLHNNYVDEQFRYPTGGYEVYVRDRDASTRDELKNYRKQVAVEVLSDTVYGNSPFSTVDFAKWDSNFSTEVAPLDADIVEGYIDWGELLVPMQTKRIKGLTEGLLIHAQLEELLYHLQEWAKENNAYLDIHGGGVSPKALLQVSFDGLGEEFDLEKDPFGVGLLRWMGRTVDLAIYQDSEILRDEALFNVIRAALQPHEHYQLTLELLLNSDRQTSMSYYRLGLHPVIKVLSMHTDDEIRENERQAQRTESFHQFRDSLQLMVGTGKVLGGFAQLGVLQRYLAFTDRFVQTRGITVPTALTFGLSWYNEQGDIERTVSNDDSITFQQTYEEPLARRFSYLLKRIGRYYPLYQQLGLIGKMEELPEKPMLVRLPRVENPRVPTIEFQGNHLRDDIPCTEWLIREHEEEAMVQSNETLRNRLGYRSLAWSLFAEVNKGWRQWSGWDGADHWLNHEFTEEEGVAPLTEEEITALKADAKWSGDSQLKPDASLKGHPFTELLEPKGMVIRAPELPYYYRYRLAISMDQARVRVYVFSYFLVSRTTAKTL